MKITVYTFTEKEFSIIMSLFSNLDQALNSLEEVVTGLENTVAEEPTELSEQIETFLTRMGDLGARLINVAGNVEYMSETAVEEPVEEVTEEEVPVN